MTPSDRVELIHGEIIKMSPIKSSHAGIVNCLNRFLILNLLDTASIISQNPLSISDTLEPGPDVMIAKSRQDEYKTAHPPTEDVYSIIEVADSSLFYDRQIKKRIYAQAGISEY
ncbi:MAG: Uma2 family endonuclease [Paraglaciecola sp.]